MKTKILTLFILGMFLFNLILISSVIEYGDTVKLGIIKQGDNYTFDQTCNDATFITITTLQYPDGSSHFINENMTYLGSGTFQYNFTNNSDLGNYYIKGISDGCIYNMGNIYYTVTPSGKISSTGESILYFLLTMIIFLLFGIMVYFIVMIDSKNYYDDQSQTFGINKIKYIRILLIGFTYPVLIILLNLMNGLAVNFTTLTIFSGIIGFLFEMLLRLAWVWSIVIMAWLVIITVKDTNFKRLMTVEGYQFVK